MGHNSFIKGSITHVSLGFSHYLLVQLHLVERGKRVFLRGRSWLQLVEVELCTFIFCPSAKRPKVFEERLIGASTLFFFFFNKNIQ